MFIRQKTRLSTCLYLNEKLVEMGLSTFSLDIILLVVDDFNLKESAVADFLC